MTLYPWDNNLSSAGFVPCHSLRPVEVYVQYLYKTELLPAQYEMGLYESPLMATLMNLNLLESARSRCLSQAFFE